MKWVLALNATIYLALGIFALYSPVAMLAMIGIFMSPSGAIEIRAMYGGFEIGVAAFLFLCIRRNWLEAGLWLCVLSITGFFVARLASLFLSIGATPLLWKLLLVEGIATVLNGVALLQFGKSRSNYNRQS